jgi:cell fate regulator YaaT (PSP1 superfamily)
MGCGSCSTSGIPKGCKSNGACGVDGCEKLTVFDWLSDMELPSSVNPFDCIEVRFKNGRKEYFKNVNNLKLYMGDVVAVEGSPGHDIGAVSLTGELVRLQMKKKRLNIESPEVKKLYRKSNQRDIDLWRVAQEREHATMVRCRELVKELKLNMKLSDVEYQGDNAKATFYYIAEERVDFRELIKRFASEFKVRVEMRQIGSRQEAGKIGGIGSCGRELCCSTWLTDFRSVNTAAARYQQLSLNPTKLAGQCGKLKCCLNYELDTYLDALSKFPDTTKNLQTKLGDAYFMKMDIFKEVLWYANPAPGNNEWLAIKLEDVKAIMALNENGEKPESLDDYNANNVQIEETSYENVVGQDELTRFDNKGANKNRRSRNNNNRKRTSPNNKAPINKASNPNQKTNKPVGNTATAQPKAETKTPTGENGQAKKRPNRRRFKPKNKGNQSE